MSELQKVAAGDPLSIPASTYNAMVDAAQAHRDSQAGRPDTSKDKKDIQSGNLIYVKNTSSEARKRFDIMGLGPPVISPTANQREFEARVMLQGVSPLVASHSTSFVILAEPLAKGRIGLAWVAGVCVVRVDVTDEALTHATIVDGVFSNLRTAEAGSIQILWKDLGTGIKWAVVHVSAGGAGTPIRFARVVDSIPGSTQSSEWLKVREIEYVVAQGQTTGVWVDKPEDEAVKCWPHNVARHYLPMKSATPPMIVDLVESNGYVYARQQLRAALTVPGATYNNTNCPVVLP